MNPSLSRLRVDNLDQPLAVPGMRPRFSWVLAATGRNVRQRGYRIVVRASSGEVVWDSGAVGSDVTSGISYDGEPLAPCERYDWELTVTTDGAGTSASSGFGTGPDEGWWSRASWISKRRPRTNPVDHHPAPCLRREFTVDHDVARATLHATAGGILDLTVNGTRVSEDDLAPGWTDYRYRVPYHSYDVTERLEAGANRLDATLGEGWYAGYFGPFGQRGYWGDVPVLRALLVIDFTDGRRDVVATDEQWRATLGPVQLAELVHGQSVDRRLGLGPWEPAQVLPGPTGKLVPAMIPAARAMTELEPVAMTQPLPGTWIVDFGQNFAGRVRLTARGPAGTRITVRHAELVRPDGTLYVDNLRTARATDVVTLAGDGVETFEPRFTFHGFRYAEITGYPGDLTPADVTGVAVSSIRETALEFHTDSPLLNKLQDNLRWTMLSNFIEVPTDCPNRDERLGWGGDAQIFAATAMMNADVEAFMAKWLCDIADAQKPNGAFADIAPGHIVDFAEEGAAGYADAGVFVPWDLHRHYGAPEVLEEFLERGWAWLRYIAAANPDHVWRHRRNADYGDWLSTVPTDKALTATAYWAHAAQVLAGMADALGRGSETEGLRDVHARVAEAFRQEFLDDTGRLRETTQTANILALNYGLLLPEQVPLAREALVADVERRGHLTSGFLGVRHACQELEAAGRSDLAFGALLRTERPSLGHQVEMGLTTIGEHWSAWDDDGELLDPYMNSFNHFALGSVFEWLYAALGAPQPLEPRFRRFLVAPIVGGPVGSATIRFDSPSGPIGSSWRRDGRVLELDVEVPANTTATIRVPGTDVTESGAGLGTRDVADGPRAEGTTVVTVGSGKYSFRSELEAGGQA